VNKALKILQDRVGVEDWTFFALKALPKAENKLRYRHTASTSNKDGALQSYDDQPALVTVETVGLRATCLEWFENGQVHRMNGPARVSTYNSGVTRSYWYRNGMPIRKPKGKLALPLPAP
jgi:hypothetical protein